MVTRVELFRAAASGFIVVAALLVFWSLVPEHLFEITLVEYHGFYEPVARSLLAGDGLRLPDGSFAVAYPPGHPAALAAALAAGRLFGVSDVLALRGLTLFCFGLTGSLAFLVARDVWGAGRALLAPALLAIYPPGLWMSLQPTSEVSFLPLLAGSTVLAWRAVTTPRAPWSWALGAGLTAGAAMLVRPAAIGLAMVLAAVTFVLRRDEVRRRAACAALVVVGAAVVVAPWEAVVIARTGALLPLSSSGPPSICDGLTFAVSDKGYRADLRPPAAVEAFMTDVKQRWAAGERRIVRTAAAAAVSHPVGALQVAAWKAARAWYGTDSQRRDRWIMIVQLPVLGLLGAATWSAIRRGGDPRRLAVMMAALVAYSWVVTVAALSILRYMTPVLCLWLALLPGLLPTASVPAADGQSRK